MGTVKNLGMGCRGNEPCTTYSHLICTHPPPPIEQIFHTPSKVTPKENIRQHAAAPLPDPTIYQLASQLVEIPNKPNYEISSHLGFPSYEGRKEKKESWHATPTPTLHLKSQKKIHGKFTSCSSYLSSIILPLRLVPTSMATKYYSAPLFAVLWS